MTLTWNPWAPVYVFIGLGQMALAVVVYRVRSHRFQNWVLAGLLGSEGLTWILVALRFSALDPTTYYAAFASAQVGWAIVATAYLLFLGTLDTPLSRPLGTRTGRIIVVALGLVAATLLVARTETFFPGVQDGSISRWSPVFADAGTGFWLVTASIGLYGFFVALSLFLRSPPGSWSRSQAMAYLIALGSRDVGYAVPVFVGFFAVGSVSTPTIWLISGLATGAYTVSLGYGFLRYQLLGIDVKIKWTLKQSTVAAMFIATFFVVSEGAAALFEAQTGSTVAGIIAAGALVFAIAPLQRLAERVSDKAMPGVKPVGEMSEDERLTLYRGQLVVAYADGAVEAAERAMLQNVRERLGITADEAERIEREVVDQAAGAP